MMCFVVKTVNVAVAHTLKEMTYAAFKIGSFCQSDYLA